MSREFSPFSPFSVFEEHVCFDAGVHCRVRGWVQEASSAEPKHHVGSAVDSRSETEMEKMEKILVKMEEILVKMEEIIV